MSDFYKRMLQIEINKDFLCRFREHPSDFLIVDSGSMRFDLLKYESNGEKLYYSLAFEDQIQKLCSQEILPPGHIRVHMDDITDEELDWYVSKFCEQILNLYKPEQIIINECYPVPLIYDGKNFSSFCYEEYSGSRKTMYRGFECFKRHLIGSHVIKFPDGVIADANHKWGTYSLHYVKEYYDYALKAIDLITSDKYSENKKELDQLCIKYEEILSEKYESEFTEKMRYYRRRDGLCAKISRVEQYERNLLTDKSCMNALLNFFVTGRFNHCAFYGVSEICKVLIPILKKWGVIIDYIVEDLNITHLEDIPLISRQEKTYPDTQLMIITDVIHYEEIKQKLGRMKFKPSVYDMYEIIKH